jgi:hypothetical protein
MLRRITRGAYEDLILPKGARIVLTLALVIGFVALLLAAMVSLRWRYVHDSPLMIYAGYLINSGAVPYRDFFDMNMPGTYAVMLLMGRVFGWDDLGFRYFDLLCIATLSTLTFLWMRGRGRFPALTAAIAFPLWYLAAGPGMSLQREFIALLPFATMLAIATVTNRLRPLTRMFLLGFLSGMTVLVKPSFIIMCLPVILYVLYGVTHQAPLSRSIALLLLGMSVPLGTAFLYLICTGSLMPFLDIAINYWPLYTNLSGSHETISGGRRLLYLARGMRDGLFSIYLPMALIGIIVLIRAKTPARETLMLSGLLVTSAIYPAMSGQFWEYHWMPFYYVALCAASLSSSYVVNRKVIVETIAPVLAITFLLFTLSSLNVEASYKQLRGNRGVVPLKDGVPDDVFRFLSSNMKPGDTVQPLDWTGGAVHGMLMARAKLATRFMYDFHFYHHVSTPYIQRLRKEFMNELANKKPAFIIEIVGNKPWPAGADTTREFPELQAFLGQYYIPVQTGTLYTILERK